MSIQINKANYFLAAKTSVFGALGFGPDFLAALLDGLPPWPAQFMSNVDFLPNEV
jgi:hypothetical protein